VINHEQEESDLRHTIKVSFLALTLVLGTLLLFQPGRSVAAAPHSPVGHRGILDLENWQQERDACLPLAGQWEFYWGALLSPHDFRSANPPPKTGWFTMPSVWNGTVVSGRELDGHGFATFRLRLRGLAQQERLALLIPYAFSA
jgi:hypothetical protein